MKYLLDTNICIYFMKNQPVSVAARLALLRIGDVCISSVTQAELEQGVLKQPDLVTIRQKQLDELLKHIPSIPFDSHAARSYGQLRVKGTHPGRNRFDTLIAAQAIASNLILVTNNTEDFKGFDGLVLENWAE